MSQSQSLSLMAHQFKVGGASPEGTPLLFCEACGTFSNQPAAQQPCPNKRVEVQIPMTPTIQPVVIASMASITQPVTVKCDVVGCMNAGASVCVLCDNPICLHHTTMNPRAYCPDCVFANSVGGIHYGGIACCFRYGKAQIIGWLVLLVVCVILIIVGASDISDADNTVATDAFAETTVDQSELDAGVGAIVPGSICLVISAIAICSTFVTRCSARSAYLDHNAAVNRLQQHQRVMACSNSKLNAKYNETPLVIKEWNPVETVRNAVSPQ